MDKNYYSAQKNPYDILVSKSKVFNLNYKYK